MLLSEARKIRRKIVDVTGNLDYCNKKQKAARSISRDVMRAINNEREEVALELGGAEHLAKDYEINERYVRRLNQAISILEGGNNDENMEG